MRMRFEVIVHVPKNWMTPEEMRSETRDYIEDAVSSLKGSFDTEDPMWNLKVAKVKSLDKPKKEDK